MSRYKVFIPGIFNKQEDNLVPRLMPQVKSFVKSEIDKLSTAFIKTDGSNEPSSDINFNQNTATNVRESNDKHEPVIRKELDEMYDIIDPIYNKISTPLNLTDVKVTTSSEFGGNGTYGKARNLIDGDPRTQWIIKKEDVDTYVWVWFEMSTPKQIYRCELSPRTGKQKSTHTLTHYTLEGSPSLDSLSYNKIFESTDVVDQDRSFEFDVTPGYKYFKLTCTGIQQFGLTAIKFYEATLRLLDDPMYIETYQLKASKITASEIRIAPELYIRNRQISGLRQPKRNDHAANKAYVDDQLQAIKLYVGRMINKVRGAAFTYGGSNLQPGDQLRMMTKYNQIGTLSDGTLTFTAKGILHVSIQLRTTTATESEVNVQLEYIERQVGDETHGNAVEANLSAGDIMKVSTGILDVVKDGQIRLIADSVIPDINVIVEMEQIISL